MKNKNLAEDYIKRATHRLVSLDALYNEKAWADVVRDAQAIVELALKGLLRFSNIEVPRVHDVSDILIDQESLLPEKVRPEIRKLADISRTLRRDRELAFYGSEDLTPSEFYTEQDAQEAREQAQYVVHIIRINIINDSD